jgi:hypothetical protein
MQLQSAELIKKLAPFGSQGLEVDRALALVGEALPGLEEHLRGHGDVCFGEGRMAVRPEARQLLTGEHILRLEHQDDKDVLHRLMEAILARGCAGATYKELLEMISPMPLKKLDELSISHYCRKLMALRLIAITTSGNCKRVYSTLFHAPSD